MIIKEVMDGQLHLAPFSRANPPRKVLDIATGTGTWAIEMGDLYPEAEIIGTDLSPIQPEFVPPNVHFFVEDSYASPSLTPIALVVLSNMLTFRGCIGLKIGMVLLLTSGETEISNND